MATEVHGTLNLTASPAHLAEQLSVQTSAHAAVTASSAVGVALEARMTPPSNWQIGGPSQSAAAR